MLSAIWICFAHYRGLSVSEQLGFSATFSDILKDDRLDLVFLNSSSLPLQYKTLEDGQLLYSRTMIFSRFRGNSNQTLLRLFHLSRPIL